MEMARYVIHTMKYEIAGSFLYTNMKRLPLHTTLLSKVPEGREG
jgi:hypothetical protein